VGLQFYLLRWSIVVVRREAVEQMMGMSQFFGHRAPMALVENFSPAMTDAVTVAMDDPMFKNLMIEVVICHDCHNNTSIDLPRLAEKTHARRHQLDT